MEIGLFREPPRFEGQATAEVGVPLHHEEHPEKEVADEKHEEYHLVVLRFPILRSCCTILVEKGCGTRAVPC